MLSKKVLPVAMATILALGGTASVVYAEDNVSAQENALEAAAVLNAKISLTQAIAAAEQITGGKVIRTGVENQNGTAIFYDITVAKNNTLQKVIVDMQTGKAVKTEAATDTQGTDGEQAD